MAEAVVLFVLAWGILVEPRLLSEDHEVAVVPGLPPAWGGEEIAFLSDFQVGMEMANTGTVADAVASLVDDPPAAVLLGGDFVYGRSPDISEQVATVIDLVAPLVASGIPTFAVLGNHEHAAGASRDVTRALEGAGVNVLRNDAIALSPPGAGGPHLHLVGMGSHIAGRDRPVAALNGVPDGEPRIVFMHNPASFAALPPASAPFAVAGHTHGGQMRVPFLPEWSYLALIEEGPVTVDGWIDGYGERANRLYVSRGIGMSRIAMRINCRPQLVRFTLAAS